MPEAKEENEQAIVFDLADQAVIAHAALPNLSETRAGQGVPDAVRIVHLGHSIMQELQNGFAVPGVKDAEFPINLARQFNSVGHDV
jgi:hypothetical protein